MIETHLNIFDAVVLTVMALSCLFAFFRGFVREVLSLGAWIGAALITIYYFPAFAEKLKPHFKNEMIAAGLAALGLYVGSLIVFSIINSVILKFTKQGSDIGLLDNFLGLIFGAFLGAFIIALGFFIMSMNLNQNKYPDWLKNSITMPYVKQGAVVLASVAPEYLRDMSTLTDEAKEEAQKLRTKKEELESTDTHE